MSRLSPRACISIFEYLKAVDSREFCETWERISLTDRDEIVAVADEVMETPDYADLSPRRSPFDISGTAAGIVLNGALDDLIPLIRLRILIIDSLYH